MALRRSTALLRAIASQMPYTVARGNARYRGYTGVQPASSDLVPSGTLLGTYTPSGDTPVDEVKATVVMVLSGSSGSIDTLTVGGGIPLIDAAVAAGSLALMADALADAINAKQQIPFFTAVSNGVDTVTISGPVGMGADCNGITLAHTETTTVVTVNGGSSAAFGGTGSTAGVDADNLCNMAYPNAAGVLTKEAEIWQMVAIAGGTLGYIRIEYDGADDQSEGTTFRREDISVSAGSGADLQVGTTTIVQSQTYSIDAGTFTCPPA